MLPEMLLLLLIWLGKQRARPLHALPSTSKVSIKDAYKRLPMAMIGTRKSLAMHGRDLRLHARLMHPWPAHCFHRNVICQAARKTTAVDPAGAKNGTTKAAANVAEKEKEAKRKALLDTLKSINHKHGAGSIMAGSEQKVMAVPRTSSGCLQLDRAMGGGYPKGRIIEIYGPESSGKTTLAMHAIAEVQKEGGIAAFIDAEHAFDRSYAEATGIKMEQLVVSQPDYGEMAFSVMDDLARSGAVDLIVVDSVSALVPRSELEGDFGVQQVGSQARMMSNALRKVCANAAKNNCTIIFINQLRYKVGVMYGNPETTSGGNALKFYASVRLDIRAKDKIEDKKEVIGNRVKVKVVKNKVSNPFETAEFDIIYGKGINGPGDILDAAVAMQIVDLSGSWYKFEGSSLAQGRDKTQAHLRENPDLYAKIEQKVQEKLRSSRTLLPTNGGSRAPADEEDLYDDLDQEGPPENLDDDMLDDIESKLD